MTFADRLAFEPLIAWPALVLLAVAAALGLGLYAWRRGGAPILRGLGLALVLTGLAGPMIVREQREPVPDVAAVLIDVSESLTLAGRAEAARAAGQQIADQLAKDSGLEVRVREVQGGAEGTQIAAALQDALADAQRERIAGAIIVTDGQASDMPSDPERLAQLGPVHALIVGDPERGDRRLELISAPAFGIVGEPLSIEAQVNDPRPGTTARVRVLIDGRPVRQADVAAGKPFSLSIRTPKRGANLVVLEVDPGPEEISAANNRAAFTLAGVRDRLRVLLVTGAPHPGARVWRNLLKSDPSVDLVHFTILRPPDKIDAAPLDELALIAFPTRELFSEKLDEFDLIIFDRYQHRGLLPIIYFENIARRVENGGALLVAAGPMDAGFDSLHRTPLAAILPSQPKGLVVDGAYRAQPTALGARHPVIRGLPDPTRWGRWTRLIAADAAGGQVLLDGPGGAPLLVLDRAGQGRVAQLWSDQVWLWARGHDGGGPHGEFLRRLAHWLMQEPELEDERLTLEAEAGGLVAQRATLGAATGPVDVIGPDGVRQTVTMAPAAPGLWRGRLQTSAQGIYEARSGPLRAFAALGPLNPKEASAVNATDTLLKPLAQASGGTVKILGESAAPLPEIRRTERNDRAFGEGWIGLRQREGFVVRASAAEPLGPGWVWAAAGVLLLMAGWRREAG
jgi:hypothetical protein